MGKSRRNRASKNKGAGADPKPKPKPPPSDPELAALREQRVVPVLRDLLAGEPGRQWAAAEAVAAEPHGVARDPGARKLLLREGVVRRVLSEILAPGASADSAGLEAQAAGWHVLRALAAEEGPDFCVHLYRQDVVPAIQDAARKTTETLTTTNPAFSKLSKTEQGYVWRIAEALPALAAAVAEADSDAFEAVAGAAAQSDEVARLLLTLPCIGFAAPDVVDAALLAALTLSEDNDRFARALLAADDATGIYARLASLSKSPAPGAAAYRAVLAAGILHNVFSALEWYDQSPGRDGASDAVLVPALARSLELARAQQQGSRMNGHGAASSSSSGVAQLALEILASIGTTLQESLEKANKKGEEEWEGFEDNDDDDDAMDDADIIGDDDDDDDENLSEAGGPAGAGDEDHEMDDDAMEADMEMVTAADDYADEADGGVDDLPTLRELLHTAVPQILAIARAPGPDDGDNDGAEAEAASSSLRTHAFAALNNVSWTVSCIDFSEGQNAAILRAWTPVARAVWRDAVVPVLASDTSDVGLATVVTSLAWALARTLHGEASATPFLAGDEHKKFMALYQASKTLGAVDQPGQKEDDDPFQGLGVKCVGVLGQLARDPAPVELNREIGTFLLTEVVARLPEDAPAADAVEALNQLFDIYGDETRACDAQVFWRDGFLRRLEEAVPKFRAAAKRVDRGKAAELRQRADETLMNLTRFIQYKQKHRP